MVITLSQAILSTEPDKVIGVSWGRPDVKEDGKNEFVGKVKN
jgi:hypothetical protein